MAQHSGYGCKTGRQEEKGALMEESATYAQSEHAEHCAKGGLESPAELQNVLVGWTALVAWPRSRNPP